MTHAQEWLAEHGFPTTIGPSRTGADGVTRALLADADHDEPALCRHEREVELPLRAQLRDAGRRAAFAQPESPALDLLDGSRGRELGELLQVRGFDVETLNDEIGGHGSRAAKAAHYSEEASRKRPACSLSRPPA